MYVCEYVLISQHITQEGPWYPDSWERLPGCFKAMVGMRVYAVGLQEPHGQKCSSGNFLRGSSRGILYLPSPNQPKPLAS